MRNWGAAVLAACLLALAAVPSRADLATFAYGNSRTGQAPAHAGIPATSVPRLRSVWHATLDGAITAQPLLADDLRVGKRSRDVAFIATEHGQIAALDADTGATLWHRHVSTRTLEPDCGSSPDGRFGVTGTMAFDRRAGLLYAVDVDGKAWALKMTTGSVSPGWPVRVHPSGDDFVWGGLAVSRGWLYVSVASLCDSGHYNGGVAAVDVRRPRTIRRWYATAGTPAYAGGIWGWGGVSIDPGGDVYGATGNSLGTADEATGYAESVVRLNSTLALEQANDPLKPPFAIGDRDFGTTPVLFQARGCPAQLVAINKDGELFLYDRDHISDGPRQRLRVAADSPDTIPLYGVPAYDGATGSLVLVSPSSPPGTGLRAGIQAFTLGAHCRLALRWQHDFDLPDAGSAPTIADGVLYLGAGRNGFVRAFSLRDGHQLWARRFSTSAQFAAPAVDHQTLVVGDWGGHVWGLKAR